MLKKLLTFVGVAAFATQVLPSFADSGNVRSVYDYRVRAIDGTEVDLSIYRGQVLMVVNTASKCGFTGQYEDLEEIYQKYKDRGFVVLAFPSNDFGGQEPGSNEEIQSFCSTKFQTSFPLFEKRIVKGPEKDPLFYFLTEEANPKLAAEIKWNFEKFLVDRSGRLVERYWSITKPNSSKVNKRIEELLDEGGEVGAAPR